MKSELLAPAGNLEAGYAALFYGADAVYLGLRRFSARAGAENFDEADLDAITAYAHHLKRKVYVAINTLIEEDELSELLEMLDICRRCKVDAVIVQDMGVARVVKNSYPEIELHASTQMAVHNREGAQFLYKNGFSRVVLARELSRKEIADIASISGLETEAFIHGALCYSYSGLCQFSSLELGRSANRGKCAYPCRACFRIGQEDKHVFSMKDMALENDVLNMPVTSLKIEGRKKSALYVAAVTDYYRKILDGKGADANLAENIRQIFSRPWCKFHFNGKNKDVVDPDFVGHRGLLIGTIEQITNTSVFLRVKHAVGRYDGLQIDVPGLEKPFGFSVQDMRLNKRGVFAVQAGDYAEIRLPKSTPVLKKGMAVYLASSTAVKSAYKFTEPKSGAYVNASPIEVKITVSANYVRAECGNYAFALDGKFAAAEFPEKVKDSFFAAFAKTGGTTVTLEKITVVNPSGLFVPVSRMNELRRGLYAQIRPETKTGGLPAISAPAIKSVPRWIVKTDCVENLSLLNLDDFAEVIVLIRPDTSPEDISVLPLDKVRLALPAVCRHPERYCRIVEKMFNAGYKKWEVANYWAPEMLSEKTVDISFDASLYTLNSQAVEEARELGASRITLALEDTRENMRAVAEKSSLPVVAVVYQDIPLFISAVCVRADDCAHCSGGEQWISMSKGGRKYQALSCDCRTMLFNEEPFCIAGEVKNLPVDFYRMDFCYRKYTPQEVKNISVLLRRYTNVRNSRQGNLYNQNF